MVTSMAPKVVSLLPISIKLPAGGQRSEIGSWIRTEVGEGVGVVGVAAVGDEILVSAGDVAMLVHSGGRPMVCVDSLVAVGSSSGGLTQAVSNKAKESRYVVNRLIYQYPERCLR